MWSISASTLVGSLSTSSKLSVLKGGVAPITEIMGDRSGLADLLELGAC